METLVGVAVFLVIAITVYQVYTRLFEGANFSETKIIAAALANEQAEIIRNLPFSDVGLVSGIPIGKIQPVQNTTKSGREFIVTTTIRNVDDPFDGLLGGAPNDLSPADYKLVEINITCSNCKSFIPVSFTTSVAPKNLETVSNNGALFIQVFDANGVAISGASAHIENNAASPAIVIDDVTNNAGMLQIVDAPPGVETYEITVTKSGYTTDKTYLSGAPTNPNPLKPHATVAIQQVTSISFAIDRVSTMDVASVSSTCAPIGNIDFSMSGSRLIGTVPDVFKYSQNHTTNASGIKSITNLEWDTYNLNFTDTIYDLAGSIPLLPIILAPNAVQDVKFIMVPKNPQSLMVTVKDAVTGLPVSDALVNLVGPGYDTTLTTNRGFLTQTDWSGGSGQASFTDPTMYFESSDGISVTSPAGEIKLREIFGIYDSSGNLTSSSFDIGSPGNFHNIIWQPTAQPPDTGADSVKFQIATNNDNATWNFLGPDGTLNTYYTTSSSNINAVHNNDRYFRYKAFLSTASTMWTPNIADVSFTFTSSCVPPGQVIFTGLANGNYDINITHALYQNYSSPVNIGASWQAHEAVLNP